MNRIGRSVYSYADWRSFRPSCASPARSEFPSRRSAGSAWNLPRTIWSRRCRRGCATFSVVGADPRLASASVNCSGLSRMRARHEGEGAFDLACRNLESRSACRRWTFSLSSISSSITSWRDGRLLPLDSCDQLGALLDVERGDRIAVDDRDDLAARRRWRARQRGNRAQPWRRPRGDGGSREEGNVIGHLHRPSFDRRVAPRRPRTVRG